MSNKKPKDFWSFKYLVGFGDGLWYDQIKSGTGTEYKILSFTAQVDERFEFVVYSICVLSFRLAFGSLTKLKWLNNIILKQSETNRPGLDKTNEKNHN